MRSVALVATLVFLCAPTVGIPADPAVNYCQDPAAEGQWQDLLSKNPSDLDVHALHALRVGLCAKVERGDVTVSQATNIFERARGALLLQRAQQELREGHREGAGL